MERSDRLFSESVGFNSTSPSAEKSLAFESRDNDEIDVVDAVDILEASKQFKIPSIFLSRIGDDRSGKHEPSTIGSGLTSQIVFHYPDDDTAGVVDKREFVIAIKLFTYEEPDDVSSPTVVRASKSRVYASILREIKVFGNPILRAHENIAKLHFIGWNRGHKFPVLAMELGIFGTLDHVLRNRSGLKSDLSIRDQEYITFDIAAGLSAIHGVGFVHGDLKPENIIIMPHYGDRERQIVAKILDFGGSTQQSDGSYLIPLHFTPLWCAPEVPERNSNMDWQKCDMYSYGLVVSSIWGRSILDELYGTEGLSNHLRSSIVSNFVSASTNEKDFIEDLRKMQRMTDGHPASLISRLRQHLQPKFYEMNTDASLFLDTIMSTLSFDQGLRPTAVQFLETLRPVIEGLGRETPSTSTIEGQAEVNKEQDDGHDLLPEEVGSETPQEATGGRELQSPDVSSIGTFKWPASWPFGMDQHGWGRGQWEYLRRILQEHMPVLHDIPQSIDYIKTLNIQDIPSTLPSDQSEVEFLDSLREAVTRLETNTCPATQRLFLSPNFQKRGRAALYMATARAVGWSITSQDSPFPDQPDLQLALATADADMATHVLRDGIESHSSVRVPPHFLHELCDSSFSDMEAVSLVSLAYQAGAKLDIIRPFESRYLRMQEQEGSPLLSAIVRGRPRLASAILSLHVELKVPIRDHLMATSMAFRYLNSKILNGLLSVLETEPSICYDGPQRWSGDQMALTRILDTMYDANGLGHLIGLERFATHGIGLGEARTDCIAPLLFRGVVPKLTENGILELALSQGDVNDLKLLVRYLQIEKVDITSIFRVASEENNTRRDFSWIGHISVECFEYLIQDGILSIEQVTEQTHHYVSKSKAYDRKFGQLFRILMKHGSDPMFSLAPGHTILWFALSAADVVAADAIAQACSDTQLTTLLCESDDSESMLWRLLQPLVGSMPDPLPSLRWIVAHGGAIYRNKNGLPVWHSMMDRSRPTSRAYQLRELQLMAYLLDTFPHDIAAELCPCCHRGLIHMAAENGHIEILRLLIRRGYNLDFLVGDDYFERWTDFQFIEWSQDGMSGVKVGNKPRVRVNYTALDLVWLKLQSGIIPNSVKNGGALEILQWRTSIAETVDLLFAAEAKSRCLSEARFGALSSFRPDRTKYPPQSDPLEVFRYGEKVSGVWPAVMPSKKPNQDDNSTSWHESQNGITHQGADLARDSQALFWGESKDNKSHPYAMPLPGLQAQLKNSSIQQGIMETHSNRSLKFRMPRWTRCDYVEGYTSLLHVAAAINAAESLSTLLQDGIGVKEVNMRDERGLTPPIMAVTLHRTDVIQILIQGGADIEARDSNMATPLHNSIWPELSLPMAKCLVDLGADVNSPILTPSCVQFTPLSLCLMSGDYPEIIKALVNHGANIDVNGDPLEKPWFQAVLMNRDKSIDEIFTDETDLSWPAPVGKGIRVESSILKHVASNSRTSQNGRLQALLRRATSTTEPFFWHVEIVKKSKLELNIVVSHEEYDKGFIGPKPKTPLLEEANEPSPQQADKVKTNNPSVPDGDTSDDQVQQ
ncbi:serine threonine protein kinase [Fusarium austroafricanum]|uniref:Serine threonine protein kinase n=1 Tax=Fusarium austroafricanum TaxID=2364996 RepID=A0A8H4KH42_9HYPO|nr:serine threonine protein kinase [Fusarium austroafricanum]